METHVCINCGIKQPEPQSPLKWCAYCFKADIVELLTIRRMSIRNLTYPERYKDKWLIRRSFDEPGFIFLGYSSDIDKYYIDVASSLEDAKNIATYLKCKIVHKIPATNMSAGISLLYYALLDKEDGESLSYWFNLSTDYVEYIKTITGYKDEKFIFE